MVSSNLGFPRIGPKRELKKALESFWSGKISEEELLDFGRSLRRQNWLLQKELGIHHIPSNDFSLYDHVLDTIALVGAVPRRYGWRDDWVDLRMYFSMARGVIGGDSRSGVPAMEMTKWMDTNYHYIVPEFEPGQSFRLASTKPWEEFQEAKAIGVHTRPVLLGPISFLLLGKPKDQEIDPISLLPDILPVYEEVLRSLAEVGAEWVQVDEPCLALNLTTRAREALTSTYERLSRTSASLRLLLTTYFGDLRDNLPTVMALPVAGVHLDLVRAPAELERALEMVPPSISLSLGLVDGRNVWRTDLEGALRLANRALETLGKDRVLIAPSCSLLHVPLDLNLETGLDEELRSWLAFAIQKLEEVVLLTRAVQEGPDSVREALEANREALRTRKASRRIHNEAVKQRLASVTDDMLRRKNPFAVRRKLQQERLRLPLLPTTTIGSFPQTPEVRSARAAFRSGKMGREDYEAFLRQETERALQFQEEVGLDLLVHGEFERTDMVEYFGEQLSGFACTKHAWVQSYGSRCVKPPIIYGDVERPRPMTVEWSRFAQSRTKKLVKGIITGPVTILQWSFVRDDQPRSETCRQIALAIRDEATDLEAAGIQVIQIDEPALREGLPLRREDWEHYLKWAVEVFRLASSGVRDKTHIHTHMCYAEFNDVIESISALDADVISLESSRSQMDLLDAFAHHRYRNEIGPGVYDIHSPRVPDRKEIEALLRKALEVLPPENVWVNPDCGLKTRSWEEVKPALQEMVEAARRLRAELGGEREPVPA
ncbi:MAG: 5-methyltetrahydropteroyltriglutamate--homocysteine S-methyltransferase [Nitrospinota bacterium]